MIDLINLFRNNLDSSSQKKIETRLVEPNDPNLMKEEVDVAIIINTIGYIKDRTSYLKKLKESLRKGGRLMIVDFKIKRIPEGIAPTPTERVSILDLENILDQVGYTAITTDDTSLDYQYIILADN